MGEGQENRKAEGMKDTGVAKPKTKGMATYQRRVDVAMYFVEHNLVGVAGYREAMLKNGYKKQYAREHCDRKFNMPETIRLIAEEKDRRGYSKEKAVKLLEELREECETANDRTNKLGAIKELDRIHGLYGDEDTGVLIQQLIVSPEQRILELKKELKLLDDIEVAPLAIAE